MENRVPLEDIDRQRVDVFTKQHEKLKTQWQKNSFWHKLKQGPLASTLYAMTLYPRVFFDQHISKKSQHPSLTVYQETAIRTIRRSLNSSLPTIRSNSAFIESPLKVSWRSEPIEPIKDVTGVKGHWLGAKTWKGRQAEAILLYVHGGGYVSSSPSGTQSLCYLLKTLRVKHDKHIRALIVDYDLAPENPYPSGLNSIERAYRWLAKSGISGSQNIFLCGTSAGGTLVLALLQKLYVDTAASALPRPLGAILISPWVEVTCDAPSYFTNSKFDILTTYFCQLAAENYLFGKEDNPVNGKPQGEAKRDRKEIVTWLKGIESAFDPANSGGKGVLNNEKRNTEWKHEVVSVKSHSGEKTENIAPKKKKRNSRASRTSRCSSTESVEMIETTDKYLESRAGAYSTLTSKKPTVTRSQDDAQDGTKCVKRNNSIVRFSNSLEVHTQADLDEMTNVKRGSWIRKSLEPHQELDVPKNLPKATSNSRSPSSITATDVKAITSPLVPPQTKDESNEKRSTLVTLEKTPFTNPLVSPLRATQDLLAKFPPLFISYGGREIFKDDIEIFCQKCVESKTSGSGKGEKNLEEVNVHPDVVIDFDKDMVHSYPMLLGVFGKHSKEALKKIATFLNTRIPNSSPPTSILLTKSPTNLTSTSLNNTKLSNGQKLKKQSPPISIGANSNPKSKTNVDALKTKNFSKVAKRSSYSTTQLISTSSIRSMAFEETMVLPIISSSSVFVPYSYPDFEFLDRLSSLSSRRMSNLSKPSMYDVDSIISRRHSTYFTESIQIRDGNQIRELKRSATKTWSYIDVKGEIIPNSRRITPMINSSTAIEYFD